MQHFVGQRDIIEDLNVHLRAARERDGALEHTLFCGPAGYGKSTLARLIAQELGGRLIEVAGSTLKNASNLEYHIFYLRKKDVIFVDEIHNMPVTLAEGIYNLLETGKYNGIKRPEFTFIGATNYAGDINKPLRDRFIHKYTFQEYNNEEIKQLLLENGATEEIAHIISERSRGIPRLAKQFLRKFNNEVVKDKDSCLHMFQRLKIDAIGLGQEDLSVLNYLIKNGAINPRSAIGERAICSTLGIEGSDYKNIIEPFLLKNSLVSRTPRGRVITIEGIDYLQKNP